MPFGEEASMTAATLDAVVPEWGEPLPLAFRFVVFSATAWSNSLVPPWMTAAKEGQEKEGPEWVGAAWGGLGPAGREGDAWGGGPD